MNGTLRAAVVAIVGLAMPLVARAQDGACAEPLSEERLEAALNDASEAIRRADVQRHKEVVRALEEGVPCLDFVPRPEQWADLLVGVAIVAHATGEAWQPPLATALAIHPRVNRMVGSSHEIAGWEPPPRPEPSSEVAPEGVRVFYDGELVTQIPAPVGWHLVQRRDGDGLQSLLLRDAPIPAEWLVAPELASKRRDLGWGFVGVGGGAASASQSPSAPGTFLPEAREIGGAAAAGAHGWLRLVGPVGLRFDLGSPSLGSATIDASAGPAWSSGGLTVSAGLGVRTLSATSGGEERSYLLLLPIVGVALEPLADLVLSLDGGWSPALARVHLRADQAFGEGGVRPFVGVDGRLSAGRFELLSDPVRDLPVTAVEAGAHVGLRWGKL